MKGRKEKVCESLTRNMKVTPWGEEKSHRIIVPFCPQGSNGITSESFPYIVPWSLIDLLKQFIEKLVKEMVHFIKF